MDVLFTSRNLIGDGLEICPSLRAWHKQHPDASIDLLTDDNNTAEIYKWMGVPLTVCFQPLKRHYDFEFVFDITKAFSLCDIHKCCMAEGYARLLGVEIGREQSDYAPYFDAETLSEEEQRLADSVPDEVILFAPFSRSCSSHQPGRPPNKCLPWFKWRQIIDYLRTLGKPIRITGSADDRADDLAFSEEEYLAGFPLRPLAHVMKHKTHLLVSVDNGLSHLAGSQGTPHILIYPLCLGMHYAVPWGNPHVVPIQLDPALVHPGQLVQQFRKAYYVLGDIIEGEKENAQA